MFEVIKRKVGRFSKNVFEVKKVVLIEEVIKIFV